MRPTMQKIAEKAGVSKNAVSLALRNDPSISAPTRRRIERIAAELGYHRNPAFSELMSQMRSRGEGASRATIAMFNANADAAAFKTHATVPQYVEGCRGRASALGYELDEFWMHQAGTSGARWVEILRARGIRGVVIIGLMGASRLPESMWPVVEGFPAVVTGVRTRQPALPFACVDHFILTKMAFEKALERGYRRPGLVLDGVIDELVDHRFSAGYRAGQEALPKTRRLRPFFDVADGHPSREKFRQWLEKERPDVIFTLYNLVRRWLLELGIAAPRDIGLIQLEWRRSAPEWAGMNQHNEISGKVAIDMLIGMIHRGESGVPPFPVGTLVGPTWIDGGTVRSSENRENGGMRASNPCSNP